MDNRVNSIGELFTRSKSILTSCFFELWDGVLQDESGRGLLLKSTEALQGTTEQKFSEEINKILTAFQLPYKHFGIDVAGFGFVVFDYVKLTPLQKDDSDDANQKLSKLIKCLQVVTDFNEVGLDIFDLSIDTFRTDEQGQIYPFGVFATPLWESNRALQSKAIFPYLAPKIKLGSEPNAASAVFASGVLAYGILCGKKYIKNSEQGFSDFVSLHPAPAKLDPNLPEWIDNILAKALDSEGEKRFASIEEFLLAIEQSLRTGKTDIPEAKWLPSEGLIVRPAGTEVSKKPGHDVAKSDNDSQNNEQANQKKNKVSVKHAQLIIKIIWGSTILGILSLAFSLLLSYRVIEVVEPKIPAQLEPVMPIVQHYNLRSSLLTLIAANELPEVNLRALGELTTKDYKLDIALLHYLHSTYKTLPAGFDKEIEKIGMHWMEEFGYQKTKDEVKKSLFSDMTENSQDKKTDLLISVLAIVNPLNSPEERVSYLRKLYQKSESFSYRLAGLLSEESSQEIFLPVVRDFLSARGFVDIPKNASKKVLYMLAAETRPLLGAETEELINTSSEDEIKIIATALLSNTIKVDKDFFGLALRKHLESNHMGKFSEIFVQLAQNETEKASQESFSIFKLTLGTATPKDLAVFIEWDNMNWERLMYATLATSTDEALADRAFDIISRRGPSKKIPQKLLEWIKKTNWSAKSKYAYPFGVFALKELASDEELDKAFNIILPISNSGLFHALVATEDPYLTTQAVDRIGPIVKVDDLVPLLSHPNAEVRIATVKSLVGKNDLPTLQKILANFRKERDPEVIKVYNEFHWVTRDRQRPNSLTTN